VDEDIMGAFAECAVVHEDHVARMPASLDFPSAAAVPLAALQALRDELHLTRPPRIHPGRRRGVGTIAIQIAKHLGAYVATTISSAENLAMRRARIHRSAPLDRRVVRRWHLSGRVPVIVLLVRRLHGSYERILQTVDLLLRGLPAMLVAVEIHQLVRLAVLEHGSGGVILKPNVMLRHRSPSS
jgi:D-arabinose 1-dehydrogenase-like Zn-dependent alcohol dehydrogenase